MSKADRANRLTLVVPDEASCRVCERRFAPTYAYQLMSVAGEQVTVCSVACRQAFATGAPAPSDAAAEGGAAVPTIARRPRIIAVMNQKGGTGKTTTSVNVAAGLAEAGRRTLVVDADPQGHVGVSLGVKGKSGLYELMTDGKKPSDVAVPVRPDLDIISSSDKLAAVDIALARRGHDRQNVFTTRMKHLSGYEYVIIDCGPSLSLLNLNMLVYADELLVPVACDFLSLVGVRHLLKTVERLNDRFASPIRVYGFLPTFFDRRNRISEESVERLRSRFGDLVLPPIRINARLKEAPSYKRSIFEYAPDSRGAQDYRKLCQHIIRSEER